MIQICSGHLYFIARENNKLIHVHIDAIVDKLDRGLPADIAGDVICDDVYDIAVDGNYRKVWWINKNGDIMMNGNLMSKAHSSEEFNCISKKGNVMAVSSSCYSSTIVELFDGRATRQDSITLSGEVMRLHIFLARKLDWIMAGCEYDHVHLLAVNGGKLHAMTLKIAVKFRGQQLICGICLPDDVDHGEILVYGRGVTSIKL